jgi:hypothetical protein
MLNLYKNFDKPKELKLFDEKFPELVAIENLMEDPRGITDKEQQLLKNSNIVITTPEMAYILQKVLDIHINMRMKSLIKIIVIPMKN